MRIFLHGIGGWRRDSKLHLLRHMHTSPGSFSPPPAIPESVQVNSAVFLLFTARGMRHVLGWLRCACLFAYSIHVVPLSDSSVSPLSLGRSSARCPGLSPHRALQERTVAPQAQRPHASSFGAAYWPLPSIYSPLLPSSRPWRQGYQKPLCSLRKRRRAH